MVYEDGFRSDIAVLVVRVHRCAVMKMMTNIIIYSGHYVIYLWELRSFRQSAPLLYQDPIPLLISPKFHP